MQSRRDDMNRNLACLSAIVLSGCSTLPFSGGEALDVLPVAPEAPANWAAAGVAGEADAGDWVAGFNDPIMASLIKEALKDSPTIAAQLATVEAARQTARAVYGDTLPSLSASGQVGGARNVADFGGEPIANDQAIYGLGLNASWEADLWGRLRAGIQAANADLLASEADYAAAELSLAANVATGWINLNAALAQERVAVETFEARDRIVTLTERRFSRGLTNALDVRTARSARAGAQAQIAARRQASGEAARLLEVLLGRYPSAAIDAAAELPMLEALKPSGNPALLLSRRPDIAASEARVISAGLSAEQARLALLPTLQLSASASTNGDTLSKALDPDFLASQLIASIAQPIFNGGSLKARRDSALARAEIAVANYATAALQAWREVENALAADVLLAQQEAAQSVALEEAVFAEDLATRQYQNGLVTIFNLIDAQTQRLNSESALISARSNRAVNRINYHLALGGGLPASVAGVTQEAAPAAGDTQ